MKQSLIMNYIIIKNKTDMFYKLNFGKFDNTKHFMLLAVSPLP